MDSKRSYFHLVINGCYGGFGISNLGLYYTIYLALKNNMNIDEIKDRYFYTSEIPRDDKFLVEAVVNLGKRANDSCAELVIHTLNRKYENKYLIDESDGYERIVLDGFSNNIVSDFIYSLPDPETMTPEECKKYLIKLYNKIHMEDDDENEDDEFNKEQYKENDQLDRDFNPEDTILDYVTKIRKLCKDKNEFQTICPMIIDDLDDQEEYFF
jgi:hypothetical protein